MKRTLPLVLCAILLAQTGIANEPEKPQEDVLRPVRLQTYWGPVLLANFVMSSGEFVTTCDCLYDGGSGVGFGGGAFIQYPLTASISLLGQATLQGLGAEYSDTEIRPEYVSTPNSEGSIEMLEFEKTANVTATYILLDLRGMYEFGKSGVAISIGPAVGILVDDYIEESETLKTEGIIYGTNQQTEKQFLDGGFDQLYEKETLRFALAFGLSYDIAFGRNMFISPEISYHLPFTSLVGEYSDWKHASMQAGVRVKFGL